jgi:hypothetical protein
MRGPGDQRSSPREAGFDSAHMKQLCKDCHGAPGVYSFNSYVPFRLRGPGLAGTPGLSAISIADAGRTAIAWKQQQADWTILQSMLQ